MGPEAKAWLGHCPTPSPCLAPCSAAGSTFRARAARSVKNCAHFRLWSFQPRDPCEVMADRPGTGTPGPGTCELLTAVGGESTPRLHQPGLCRWIRASEDASFGRTPLHMTQKSYHPRYCGDVRVYPVPWAGCAPGGWGGFGGSGPPQELCLHDAVCQSD